MEEIKNILNSFKKRSDLDQELVQLLIDDINSNYTEDIGVQICELVEKNYAKNPSH